MLMLWNVNIYDKPFNELKLNYNTYGDQGWEGCSVCYCWQFYVRRYRNPYVHVLPFYDLTQYDLTLRKTFDRSDVTFWNVLKIILTNLFDTGHLQDFVSFSLLNYIEMNPVYDFIQRNRVLAIIEKAQCSRARNLSLEDFDLTDFPEVLFNCQNLHYLNIRHNRLVNLPSDIGQLKNLQHVSLEYNNIDRFPEALRNLTQLVTLNINHNPIKDLTKDIASLKNLEILWCNSCCLTSLPEEIGSLIKLETLGARHNKINKLPDGICELRNLR